MTRARTATGNVLEHPAVWIVWEDPMTRARSARIAPKMPRGLVCAIAAARQKTSNRIVKPARICSIKSRRKRFRIKQFCLFLSACLVQSMHAPLIHRFDLG
jgi:hypothetical protein